MKIRDRIKELKRVPAGDLLPNPKNWRTHPAAQADALRGVLGEVGFADAVLARETENGLMLIDGHLRAEVAPDASVPVLVLDVTQDEADKILATHDPLAAMATTDAGKLADLLDGMRFDSDAATAMTESLAKAEGVAPAAEVVEDEVPEPPADPVTQPGDLWTLGDHRVLCGDSTDRAAVESLLDHEKPSLCFTDPPYGADISYDTHDDSQANLKGLVKGFFPLAVELCEVVALTPGINNIAVYPPPSWVLCWFYAAGTGRTPWGFSSWQPVLVYGKCPKLASGHGCHPDGFNHPASPDDMAVNRSLSHACPKPVTAWARFLDRLTVEAGQLVYDPFLGSGTTLIAAEQLGRKCYGLEISPAYCDVIVNRWESLTGRKAERNGARTDSETNEAENIVRRKERGPDKPKRTRSTKRQTAGT